MRELREETGYGANRFSLLDTVTLMPAYSNFVSNLYVAAGLYDDPLPGDEPEPMAQVRWPLDRLGDLHAHPRVSDARTHLVLHLLAQHLAQASVMNRS